MFDSNLSTFNWKYLVEVLFTSCVTYFAVESGQSEMSMEYTLFLKIDDDEAEDAEERESNDLSYLISYWSTRPRGNFGGFHDTVTEVASEQTIWKSCGADDSVKKRTSSDLSMKNVGFNIYLTRWFSHWSRCSIDLWPRWLELVSLWRSTLWTASVSVPRVLCPIRSLKESVAKTIL